MRAATYTFVGLSVGLVLLGTSCSRLPLTMPFWQDCCEDDRELGLTYLAEEDRFPVAAPVQGRARDVAPGEGETITKPGLLSKYNPFKDVLGDDGDAPAPATQDEEQGFFRNLWPF